MSGLIKSLKLEFNEYSSSSMRSSRPEVFFRKCELKVCSKFTGEHLCQSLISINLQSNFIEIVLRHGCSSVNLLHIFRTTFPRNTFSYLFHLLCNFIEFALRHGCSPVNWLHIFRTSFPRNT